MYSVKLSIADANHRIYDALYPEGAKIIRERSKYTLRKTKNNTLINIIAKDFNAFKATIYPVLKNIELVEKIEGL